MRPDKRSYRPIEDYALIGNGFGSALVARDGSIDWCCLTRFDAPPVFSRLLDRIRGGFFQIVPEEPHEVSRAYLPSTNILETTFKTSGGTAKLTDFMLMPHDGSPRPLLVRLVSGLAGEIALRAVYRPHAGFAQTFPPLAVDGEKVSAPGCPAFLSDTPFAEKDGAACARLHVHEGSEHVFCLFDEDASEISCPSASELLQHARTRWSDWVQDANYAGPLEQELIRSALVLKALTYQPTGAMVAAPTTSLPEVVGGVRNWDYRFCWLRDSCLAFYALKKFGYVAEAGDFFSFINDIAHRREVSLKPLYPVDGVADMHEKVVDHFEGWQGSAPVRVGNKASEQHQIDTYGQVLDLMYMHVRLGGALDDKTKITGTCLADHVAREWRKPDNGLWEPRLEPKRYLHAAIMNWAALDRAIALFGEKREWCEARTAIEKDIKTEGVHPEHGYLTQAFGEDAVDASVLVAPMVGFPVDHDVFARTVDTVIEQLARGPLVYRYLNDDGLPGHEGTFLLCAFWLVDALAWLDRGEEAARRFEDLRKLANDVGLYPEEIAEDGRFLGNFPQAFSHLGFLHSALVLDLYREGGPEALRGTYADRTLRETRHRQAPRIGGNDGGAAEMRR
ncbi:glycoside hydrolase family 15 protein [Microvirga sp. GCM10011540]|uniref:glycoside hydrolase family 15 protein n=1 Tax=Microvirga sp. GCM10011540 TaxID=3317338 RepID=UPI00361B4379